MKRKDFFKTLVLAIAGVVGYKSKEVKPTFDYIENVNIADLEEGEIFSGTFRINEIRYEGILYYRGNSNFAVLDAIGASPVKI